MAKDFNWTCPYCQHAQVVGDARFASYEQHIYVGDVAEGSVSLSGVFIGCANSECNRLTATVSIRPDRWVQNSGHRVNYEADPIILEQLLPESAAKPQPSYIPGPIVDDYVEACRIRDLSPKASATLLRRCLQGMIRDFAGIAKRRLVDEIDALRALVNGGTAPRGVTLESVDAIDHVREVGNIGAHMEADINQIVDVDPGEAAVLIELVEMLFEEWYVARQKRADRLARVAAVATDKKHAKQTLKAKASNEPQD